MSRRTHPGMGMAALLLLGVAAGPGLAQEGERLSLHSFNGPNNMYGPECDGAAGAAKHGWYPGRYILCDPLHRKSLIRTLVPPEKNCCWASPDSMGCGNLKTDFLFAFGSCRQWFGQPCLNGPPPPVAPRLDRRLLPAGGLSPVPALATPLHH